MLGETRETNEEAVLHAESVSLQQQYDSILAELGCENIAELETEISENRGLISDLSGQEQKEVQRELSQQEQALIKLQQLAEQIELAQKSVSPANLFNPGSRLRFQAILDDMDMDDLAELVQEIADNEALLVELSGHEADEVAKTLQRQKQALSELQALEESTEAQEIRNDAVKEITQADVNIRFNQAGVNNLAALQRLKEKASKDLSKAERKQNQTKIEEIQARLQGYESTLAELQHMLSEAGLPENYSVSEDVRPKRSRVIDETNSMSPVSSQALAHVSETKENREDLNHFLQQAMQLPASAERLICHLHGVARWKAGGYDQESLAAYQLPEPAVYQRDLQDWLKAEGQNTSSMNALVLQVMQAWKIGDWVALSKRTSALLKHYRPFDVAELQRLIKKADQAAVQVKDQEIILLLGRTGAGKSTTIHFLAGSTMQETRVLMKDGGYVDHVAPTNIVNAYLKEVETHPGTTSVTRYIAPVPVNSHELPEGKQGSERKPVVLCDTPGFGDTAGAEVDIANGVGVIRAIHGCKSVRPLVVLSQYSAGDRLEGIVEIVNLLIHLMPDLVEYTSSFSYIFSKFKQGTNIASRLQDLIETSSSQNEAYQVILKDMERKMRKGQALVLDPVQDHPGDLLDQLIGTTAIDNPDEVFKNYITESSEKTLSEQVNAHYYAVESLLQAEHVPSEAAIELLAHRMGELKMLNYTLDLHVVKESYQKCSQQIRSVVRKRYADGIERLTRGLRDNVSRLDDADVEHFSGVLQFLRRMEPVITEHLGEGCSENSQSLKNWLVFSTRVLQASLTEPTQYEREITDPTYRQQFPCLSLLPVDGGIEVVDLSLLSKRLTKLRLLSNAFSDDIADVRVAYEGAKQQVQKYVECLVQNAREAINVHEYGAFSKWLQFLQQMRVELEDNFSNDWFDDKLHQLEQQYISRMTDLEQIGIRVLRHDVLQETDIVELQNNVFRPLERTKSIAVLQQLLERNKLKTHDKLLNEVKQRADQVSDALMKFGQDQDGAIDGEKMEQAFAQLELIRSISPGIEQATLELHTNVNKHLVKCVNQLKVKAENVMAQLFSNQGDVRFVELRKALKLLSHVKWVDRLQPGLYDSSLTNINERLSWHLQDLAEEIALVEANISQPVLLTGLAKKVFNVEQMKQLDDVLPGLKEQREPVIQAYRQQIQNLLDSISQAYDLEHHSIKEEQQRLKQLQNIKHRYDQCSKAAGFLREKGYEEGVDGLEDELKQTNRDKNQRGTQIVELKAKIDKFRKQYNTAEGLRKAITEKGMLGLGGMSEQEKQSLLNKNGLADTDALYQKMASLQKEIEVVGNEKTTREAELAGLEQRAKQLSQDRIDYERLLDQGDIELNSANQVLQSENIESIEVLEGSICELQGKVVDCQTSALEHAFDISNMFDFNYARRVFNCLEQLGQIRVEPCRSEVRTTKQHFSRYLKVYTKYLSMRLDKTHSDVVRYLEGTTEIDITHCGQMVVKCFSELLAMRDLQSDWPEDLRQSELVSFCDQWETKLNDHLRMLKERMEQRHNEGQNLQKEISVARALVRLDSCLFPAGTLGHTVEDGYGMLSRGYTDKMYEEAREIRQDMRDSLKEHNFQQVAEQMILFQEMTADPSQRSRVEQKTQKLLDNETDKLITQARRKLAYIGPEMKLESVMELMESLQKLESTEVVVTSLSLEMIERREKALQGIKSDLNKKLNCYIDGIVDLIESFNFQHTEVRMEQLNNLVASLRADDVLEEEVLHRITDLSQQIEKGLARKVEDFSRDDYDYMLAPPKDFYEKLQGVFIREERGVAYQQAWDKIKIKIINDFRQKLAALRDEGQHLSTRDRNNHVRVMKGLLVTLPNDLEKQLKGELTNLEDDLDSNEKENAKHIDELLSNGAAEKITEEMRTCDKRQDGALAYTLKQGIKGRIETLHQKLTEKIKDRNYVALGGDLDELNQFKRHLSMVDPVVRVYKSVYGVLTKAFDEVCNIAEQAALPGQIIDDDTIQKMKDSLDELNQFIQLERRPRDLEVTDPLFTPEISARLVKLHRELGNRLASLSENYKNVFECDDTEPGEWIKILDNLQLWDPVRSQLESYVKRNVDSCEDDKNLGMSYLSEQVGSLPPYRQSLRFFVDLVNKKAEWLSNFSLSSDATKTEKGREKFYQELEKHYLFFKQLNRFGSSRHLQDLTKPVEKHLELASQRLQDQLEQLYARATKLLNNTAEPSQVDFDELTLACQNLVACSNHFKSNTDVVEKARERKQEIERLIDKRLSGLEERFRTTEDINGSVESLVALKRWGECSPMLKEHVDNRIDDLLKSYKKTIGGGEKIARLGLALSQEISGIGESIVADHVVFKGYQRAIFNRKTQACNIDMILKKIEGEGVNLNTDKLRKLYEKFDSRYDHNVSLYLRKPINVDPLVAEIKQLAAVMRNHVETTRAIHVSGEGKSPIYWNRDVFGEVVGLLSMVSALWTLMNADEFFDAAGSGDREGYLLKPHPAQVISIFRMLGIGDTHEQQQHNLVEMGTGEGKSIVLGLSSSIFALLGAEVSCACYSDYLSSRDSDAFLPLFERLNIKGQIRYGTFNEICEEVINENGDVRDLARVMIEEPADSTSAMMLDEDKKAPKVLLIDEVDVFLNEEFYGNLYRPSTQLGRLPMANDDELPKPKPELKALTDLVWSQRNNLHWGLDELTASQQYQDCARLFDGWEALIREAAKDMLADVRNFSNHHYVVLNNRIGYKEQDTISFGIVYGYKTLFAYYHEHEQGRITEDSLLAQISLIIQCGSFSYAELPKQFQLIVGVTGTLRTLSQPESDIVSRVYDIRKRTYAPSVFGDKKLLGWSRGRPTREREDIIVRDQQGYHDAICSEIENRLQGRDDKQRAVLVFFETEEKLQAFSDHPGFQALQQRFLPALTMTESLTKEEKTTMIRRAPTAGQVTLLTRTFGRGTDFVCRDKQVASGGGVHVLQTFLSEELSEETQIKGRTARQGEEGSYSMVLLTEDLEKYRIFQSDLDKAEQAGQVYEMLSNKRAVFFKNKYEGSHKFVGQARKEHELSKTFVKNLLAPNPTAVMSFLLDRNQGATVATRSRTLCLMDATCSMYTLLKKSKETVSDMFERTAMVLKEKGVPGNCFEMQYAVYRNYNSSEDKLLQSSPWYSRADHLRKFMDTIEVDGGWGNEAVEIGLWHANKEANDPEAKRNNKRLSQIILIGDAAANTEEEVRYKRAQTQQVGHGEQYWQKTRFSASTHWRQEVQRLSQHRVPIHCFFVENRAKKNFQEIAQASQPPGRCEKLDIHSSAGAEKLTDLVTTQVLEATGGSDFVDTYQEMKAQGCFHIKPS